MPLKKSLLSSVPTLKSVIKGHFFSVSLTVDLKRLEQNHTLKKQYLSLTNHLSTSITLPALALGPLVSMVLPIKGKILKVHPIWANGWRTWCCASSLIALGLKLQLHPRALLPIDIHWRIRLTENGATCHTGTQTTTASQNALSFRQDCLNVIPGYPSRDCPSFEWQAAEKIPEVQGFLGRMMVWDKGAESFFSPPNKDFDTIPDFLNDTASLSILGFSQLLLQLRIFSLKSVNLRLTTKESPCCTWPEAVFHWSWLRFRCGRSPRQRSSHEICGERKQRNERSYAHQCDCASETRRASHHGFVRGSEISWWSWWGFQFAPYCV